MKHKLTASFVKALEPQNRLYKVWDTELKGFFVSVLPSGTKTYMVNYRHEGQGRDYKIGRAFKLKAEKARTQALQALALVSTGVDIQEEKKLAKRRREQAKVAVLEKFIEDRYGPWVLLHKKSAHESLRVLNKDFKQLLKKPMEQISKWDVLPYSPLMGLKPLPTTEEPLWLLKEWKKQVSPSAFVFTNPDSGLPFDNINNAWRAVRKSAKLVDFRFHDLRHHYASTLEFMNLPLDTIRKRLGHSSINITTGYTHGEQFRDRLEDQVVIAINAHSKFQQPSL